MTSATMTDSSGQRSEGGPICACRRIAASPQPAAPVRKLARRSRGAAAWALPSVALALVPKCPMCIAAYLALGGGLGISLGTAAHLRTALLWLCWGVLALLTVRVAARFAKTRTTTRAAAAARVALRKAWRHIPHLQRVAPHLNPSLPGGFSLPAHTGRQTRRGFFAKKSRTSRLSDVLTGSGIPLRSTVSGYIKQGH